MTGHRHKIVSCSDIGYSKDPSARETLYPGMGTTPEFSSWCEYSKNDAFSLLLNKNSILAPRLGTR